LHDELAGAFRLHQAGELAAAARLYQSVLSHDPNHADALHLLGVVRHQQGQSVAAVDLIAKAVAIRPGAAAYHANLAEAYRAIGQLERAVGCCRTALQLWREYPEARINLGLALQGLGRLTEAAEQYREALALRPDDAQAHTNLGTVLRELGELEQSLDHFRRAVECNPALASARTNLGQFLLDQKRPDEALPHCEEAVRLQPNLAEAHNNLGNVQRALEHYVEARGCYFEAIRLNPDLAQAHANLGLTLQEEGRSDEAVPWLRRAIELQPESVTFLGHLAEALSERDQSAEAMACYRKMIELDPARPGTYNALAWLVQEEGRHAEAEELLRTAIRLQPDFAPAYVGLGGLQEELGDLTAAEASFRTALQLRPAHAGAHGRLATLLRGALPNADREAAEQRLADAELADGSNADLLFGLAHVCDARGQYAQAADYLREANRRILTLQEKRRQKYDSADHLRFVERIISTCGPAFFERLKGAGLPTRTPVFVFGLPRSGTTLVEQVLASHSRIHGAGELVVARQDFESLPSVMNLAEPPIVCLGAITPEVLGQVARRHEERLREWGGTAAERVVDKMPDNYLYLGLLAAMFPNAVFIHCRRDLRDVAVSCWMTNFRAIRWASDPTHICERFEAYVSLMAHWRAVLPVPILEVAYEEAVADLEPVARRLIAACGLDWEPACLAFHETRRPIRTASVTQVRQPLYTKSVARWKNYEGEMPDLLAALSSLNGNADTHHTEHDKATA
jgi:tetratricopeptide (TPR) repeat protein